MSRQHSVFMFWQVPVSRALEAAYTDIVTDNLPEWNQDPGLLSWLARL